jgi:hypothetical protein
MSPTRKQLITMKMLSLTYQLQRLVSRLPEEFSGMSFLQLAEALPEEQRAELIALLDALVASADAMRSRETRAVEVQR